MGLEGIDENPSQFFCFFDCFMVHKEVLIFIYLLHNQIFGFFFLSVLSPLQWNLREINVPADPNKYSVFISTST